MRLYSVTIYGKKFIIMAFVYYALLSESDTVNMRLEKKSLETYIHIFRPHN